MELRHPQPSPQLTLVDKASTASLLLIAGGPLDPNERFELLDPDGFVPADLNHRAWADAVKWMRAVHSLLAAALPSHAPLDFRKGLVLCEGASSRAASRITLTSGDPAGDLAKAWTVVETAGLPALLEGHAVAGSTDPACALRLTNAVSKAAAHLTGAGLANLSVGGVSGKDPVRIKGPVKAVPAQVVAEVTEFIVHGRATGYCFFDHVVFLTLDPGGARRRVALDVGKFGRAVVEVSGLTPPLMRFRLSRRREGNQDEWTLVDICLPAPTLVDAQPS